jgi:CRISPR/Cas system-associated endonuclease/helicase Cas3
MANVLEKAQNKLVEQEIIQKANLIRSEKVLKAEIEAKKKAKALQLDSEFFNMNDEKSNEMMAKISFETKLRESPMLFINEEVTKSIGLIAGSLAFITASTGTGKSTLVANITSALCGTTNKPILIITNEELETDVYKRVCTLMGKGSVTKMNIPESSGGYSIEEKTTFISNYFHQVTKKVIVIGKSSKNVNQESNVDFVTTVEGLKTILNAAHSKFDCILIDYYQNISVSLDNPHLSEYDAQARFAEYLNSVKDVIGCPIILMSQIKEKKEGSDVNYKSRIDGRKKILDYATEAVDLIVDKERKTTTLRIEKSRWAGNSGKEIVLGFDEGRLVPYVFERKGIRLMNGDMVKKYSEL